MEPVEHIIYKRQNETAGGQRNKSFCSTNTIHGATNADELMMLKSHTNMQI